MTKENYAVKKKVPSKSRVHVNPASGTKLLIDSHMHIQSGNCSTLLFVRSNIPGGIMNYADRSTIVARGKKWPTPEGPQGLAKVSEPSTDQIGINFLVEMETTQSKLKSKDPYKKSKDLFICSVVMTMDMEYAHLGGYFGLKIYNPIFADGTDVSVEGAKPACYWYPKPGTSGDYASPGRKAPIDTPLEGETQSQYKAILSKREKNGVTGHFYQNGQKRAIAIHCKITKTPDEEGALYENWKTQQKRTVAAAIEGKLSLLPMFHYDPRRWQEGDEEAFKQVLCDSGVYLGFKMYTAQGYRPWDPRLPNLERYYKRCQDEQIPILNHCTPDGAPTYDREHYINFTHPCDTTEDQAEKNRIWSDKSKAEDELTKHLEAANKKVRYGSAYPVQVPPAPQPIRRDPQLRYFCENFVSPKAWQVVLDKFPKLHLCLAHFGGLTGNFPEWAEDIMIMMESGKYPNFYADLSSSFANAHFRDHFKALLTKHKMSPKILKHVLFGTDWYLTYLDKTNFEAFCTTSKEFMDGIDKTLWPKFTEENPCRFYRIGDQIERIAKNLIQEREARKNQKGSEQTSWESQETGSKDESKAYSATVHGRAGLIRVRAQAIK